MSNVLRVLAPSVQAIAVDGKGNICSLILSVPYAKNLGLGLPLIYGAPLLALGLKPLACIASQPLGRPFHFHYFLSTSFRVVVYSDHLDTFRALRICC